MKSSDFSYLAHTVIEEITSALDRVASREVEEVVSTLSNTKRVFVLGVGREGLAARAFAMRLAHLGIDAHWGWDDTTPSVRPDDTFVLVNGSGAIGHLDYVFGQIRDIGATSIVISGVAEASTPKRADVSLIVPAAVYRGEGDMVTSVQPMGSLFEQSIFIALDVIVLMLIESMRVDTEELVSRHRNFE